MNCCGSIENFPPNVLGEQRDLALLFKKLATLRKIEVPPEAPVQPQQATRRTPTGYPAAQTTKKPKPPVERPAPHNDDEDGTLEPSFNRP